MSAATALPMLAAARPLPAGSSRGSGKPQPPQHSRVATALAAALLCLVAPAVAAAQQAMGGMTVDPPPTSPPAPHRAEHPSTMPGMDHPAAKGTEMPGMAAMTMGMGGDAWTGGSGTARLPFAEGAMRGAMFRAGGWALMAHGYAWATYTDQGGLRGADQGFVTSMAMLMADRDLSDRWHLQVKAMASLDPYLGPTGYPDLFASGEVAHGAPLVDRQHPHDLFMELSARVDRRLGGGRSLFLYGGPVAEPALGPSAFMHRGSARYLPLAPITHHWFDSTHISYGVVTGGYADRTVQVEASGFRGREPDEHRWDIEAPALDSWSVRGTWTPTANLAVQVSHGRLHSPEAQEPGIDEARTTASLQYARRGLTTTFAWSLKDHRPGHKLPALLAEAAWEIGRRHAVFGRVEHIANDEYFPDETDPRHHRVFHVTKAEGGYAYRLPLVGRFGVALGGTLAVYAKPAALDDAYGRAPVSWTLFGKFVLGL